MYGFSQSQVDCLYQNLLLFSFSFCFLRRYIKISAPSILTPIYVSICRASTSNLTQQESFYFCFYKIISIHLEITAKSIPNGPSLR
jgi:hypothetical protein